MKRIFLLFLALGLCSAASAKFYYTFSASTGTYTELDHPTVLTTTFDKSAYYPDLGITFKPFSYDFKADGQMISVNTFGAIIGKNTATDMMFAMDGFQVNDLIKRDNNSSLSYQVDGTEGSRILKVQWKNMTLKNGDPAKDYVNFQLWLYEDGSKMEAHYGPVSINSDPSKIYLWPNATGPGVGIFRSNVSFSSKYEVQFLTGKPASPNISSDYAATLDAPPVAGTVYTFEHVVVNNPPSLNLLSPLGGESWKAGETHDITWDEESISQVKIEYSTNNGGAWLPVADNVDATAKKYSWKVPNTVSSNCLVKLTDKGDATRTSQSAFQFSIQKGTGVEEPKDALRGIAVYPNPTYGKLYINGEYDRISVYAMDGRLLLSQTISAAIDLSRQPKGIYIIEIAKGLSFEQFLVTKE